MALGCPVYDADVRRIGHAAVVFDDCLVVPHGAARMDQVPFDAVARFDDATVWLAATRDEAPRGGVRRTGNGGLRAGSACAVRQWRLCARIRAGAPRRGCTVEPFCAGGS